MKKRIIKSFFAGTIILTLLTGCTAWDSENLIMDASKTQQTFQYEVPESKPSVLVNQLGYYTDSVKTAIFIGENVPDQFSIIDAKTKEEVFVGQIEHKDYKNENGICVSTGSFSDFKEAGEYYILCDVIGQSYHFEISDKIYETLLNDMLKEISDTRWENYYTETEEFYVIDEESELALETSGGWYTTITDTQKTRDVKTGSEVLINLLLSAELYLEEHSDAVGITESGNEIPDILDEAAYEALWLLKMQDSQSGAVYSSLVTDADELELNEQTIEATQYFVIAMAKFSYSMKNYDSTFATECLRASDAAWKYVESIRTSKKEEYIDLQAQIDNSLRYFGAAELYRASGAYRYHTAVKEYIPLLEEEGTWTKEEYLGTYTYLSTRLFVSKTMCEELMKQVMDLGESIAANSKENCMLSSAKANDKNCSNLLWDMTIMTSIDYIIGNHEYDTILENNLHYMLGRNENAYSYIKGYGNDAKTNEEKTGVCDDLTQTSALIFMLSEIISNR